MNVNLLQGLGSGHDAVGGTTGDANAALRRHRAWQSAMEQAQLANWFKPGGGTSIGAPSASPAPTATPALLGRVSPDPSASPAAADIAPQDSAVSDAQEASARTVAPQQAKAPPAAARVANADAKRAQEEAPASEDSAPQRHGMPAAAATTIQQAAVFTLEAGRLPLQPDAGLLPSQLALAASLARVTETPAATEALQTAPTAPIAATSLRLVATQVAQWLDVPEIDATESMPAADTPSPRQPGREAADGATRLHVEWTREGARLWLGVDQDQLQRVPTLIGQLQQWLASSGVKLLALVCNGRTVYLARRAFPPSFPSQGDLA